MGKIKRFFLGHKILFLFILLALLLRLPWLYTTIEKDEGSFGYTTWRILEGDELYKDVWENKPPFLFILYAMPIYFFGNSIVPIRFLNNALFIISIIFFFKLTKQFFTKKNAIFSTLVYIIFMNIPVFEGYLAMSESLLTPFLIVSIYLFKKYTISKKSWLLFVSSIFAIITILIKHQAGFIYLLLISGLFIYKMQNKIKKVFLLLFPLIIFLTLIALTKKESFMNFLGRIFMKLSSSFYVPFSYSLFIILEGYILFLFSLIGIIKVFKSRFEKDDIFLIFWFFLALSFTMIPPAYGHYYQFLIPPLAIFSGIGIIYTKESKQDKKLFIFLIIILSLLTGWIVIKHYPNSQFNLGKLHWGWSSLENYQQQILISDYIKDTTFPEDKVLVIGWEPSINWLSERKPPVIPRDSLLFCERYKLNTTWKRAEKGVSSYKNIKAIVFLRGHKEKCENLIKEISSDPMLTYRKKEIDGNEVYIRRG